MQAFFNYQELGFVKRGLVGSLLHATPLLQSWGAIVALSGPSTHMDAQVFWDPLGTSSCWHGITTVVMGNCGFTFAARNYFPSDLSLIDGNTTTDPVKGRKEATV